MVDVEQANTGWTTGIYEPDKIPLSKVFYAVKAKPIKVFQTYWLLSKNFSECREFLHNFVSRTSWEEKICNHSYPTNYLVLPRKKKPKLPRSVNTDTKTAIKKPDLSQWMLFYCLNIYFDEVFVHYDCS